MNSEEISDMRDDLRELVLGDPIQEIPRSFLSDLQNEIERLTSDHKANELLWWDEKGVLEDEIERLTADCETLRNTITSCQLSLKERDARVEALEGAIERARALEGFPGSNSSKWVHYELLQEALAVTEQEGET